HFDRLNPLFFFLYCLFIFAESATAENGNAMFLHPLFNDLLRHMRLVTPKLRLLLPCINSGFQGFELSVFSGYSFIEFKCHTAHGRAISEGTMIVYICTSQPFHNATAEVSFRR